MIPQTLNEILDRRFREHPSHTRAQGGPLSKTGDSRLELRKRLYTASKDDLDLLDLDQGRSGVVHRRGACYKRLQLSEDHHKMVDFETDSLNETGRIDECL